jgi:Ran-binding protein 1
MKLTPNVGSDRSWVWQVPADYAENPPTEEVLAIRVKDAAQAADFKSKFEECSEINSLIHAGDKPAELEALLAKLTIVEEGSGEKPEEETQFKKDDDDGGDDGAAGDD